VDSDIDIYDPLSVEWALATRFQGDRQMLVLPREQGSSLDPSSEPDTHATTKIGFDLTKPLKTKGKNFDKAIFADIDPQLFR
jgi:UbiD family decarboxylase